MQSIARHRHFVAIVFGIVAGSLVIAVTLSSALRSGAPQIAIALWPWNAEARGALAGRALIAGDIDKARNLALRATREAPGDARSLRALGLAEELSGSVRRGEEIMKLATRASRRDLQTNLWFIEYNVRRGDIDGAVRYYDFSLKASADSEELLFPILIQAMTDPEIARAVSRRLAQRPIWATSFLQYAISSGEADRQLIPIVLQMSDDGEGLPINIKKQYAQRLSERGDFSGLSQLTTGLGHPLISGAASLDSIGDLPPADWRLLSSAGVTTFAEQPSGIGFAARENAALAERILHLPSNQYRIQATTDLGTTARDGHVNWVMVCASNGRPITGVPDDKGVNFNVPIDKCDYQKLTIFLESDRLADGGEINGVISNIRVGLTP